MAPSFDLCSRKVTVKLEGKVNENSCSTCEHQINLRTAKYDEAMTTGLGKNMKPDFVKQNCDTPG